MDTSPPPQLQTSPPSGPPSIGSDSRPIKARSPGLSASPASQVPRLRPSTYSTTQPPQPSCGCERSQSSRLAGTTSGRIQLTAMSGSKSPFNNYCRPGGPMMTSVGNRDGIRSRRHHASPWTANDSRPPATARHFADQLHHQSDSPCSTFELVQVGKDPPRCGSLPVYEGFCLPAYGNVWRCFEALLHRQRSHTAASARIARNTGGLTPVDAIVQAVP